MTTFRSQLNFAVLSMALMGMTCGGEPDAPPNTRVEAGVQAVLNDAVQKEGILLPGAIAHYRNPAYASWTGAAGLGNLDKQTPIRPDDRVRGGSVLKTFLATVTLQHVEEGSLSLEQTLPELLPSSVTDRVANAGQITLRMLLNHTSGIPDWVTDEVHMIIATEPDRVWTIDEALDISAAQPPSFPPGQGWSYSNTNYTLVGLVLDEVEGPWRRQVRDRIVKRLQLKATHLPEPGDVSMPGHHAHGYVAVGSGVLDLTQVDPSMAGAGGGNAMVTTVEDLGVFLDALLSGALFSNPATLTAMTTMVDAPDLPGIPYSYGLGIESYEINGTKVIGHAGTSPGYALMMFHVPSSATTLVTGINAGDLFTNAMEVFIPSLDVIVADGPQP